ncbi:MAG TPA: glycosyltransferase family 39 protein [Caulobacteraceae bacterium]|jgi:4-amino-4-deoxy-L-arabinose transferase-like glycosyltransferase|nr:glycosyltransferase family 39 protein [Caulobacteraceae bacterium]
MSAPRWRCGEGFPASLIAVIGVTLAIRLVVGGLTHLTEDEAYYRLWSISPALGYFDHPPMIAWWIWLGRHIAGDTALGVRLLPILATGLTSLVVFDLARLAGGDRKLATRAGLFFNATLLVLAGGFLAVPDAAASLFWTLSLWCALRAWRSEKGLWWAAAGVAAGLACLSKYSALFLAPGMVLWLAAGPEGRRRLGMPGPWIAAAIAAAIFSLNIAWNAEHGWLTFAKQFGRIAPHAFQPRYLLELIVGQTLLLNPLIAGCALAAVRRSPRSIDLRPFFLVATPFGLYLLIHSLHDRVQAHWPAPLYPMAAILAAAGAEGLVGRWRTLARAALPVGFALGGLALATLIAPAAWLGRYDPVLPLRGWPAFASRLEAERVANGATWIGTTSYGLASELADEPALRASVAQLAERDRWQDLARPNPSAFRSPGLVVDLQRRVSVTAMTNCFSAVKPLGEMMRGDPGERGKIYAAFVVSGPRRNLLAEGCPGL